MSRNATSAPPMPVRKIIADIVKLGRRRYYIQRVAFRVAIALLIIGFLLQLLDLRSS
jgi:hypothetical protein